MPGQNTATAVRTLLATRNQPKSSHTSLSSVCQHSLTNTCALHSAHQITYYLVTGRISVSIDTTLITGEWRKLHNEELKGLYSSPNIVRVIKSRRMRWAGHVARMGEGRGVYKVLVGKPEGKRPLGRPRRRRENNIRTDLQEVGLGYEDWIGLAQDRDRWRAR